MIAQIPNQPSALQIAIAPVSYYWRHEQVRAFYAEVAASAADIVYLGEVVCSRRHQLKLDDWLQLAGELRDAGKTALLSTQTLIESDAERRAMQQLVERASLSGFMVEANDLGAVRMLAGRPFVAGPHLNAYHGATLHWLASMGAQRFVAPLEMSGAALDVLLHEQPPALQAEVMVWGRMPLAYSARCFTARHFHLTKDQCGFRCSEHPDGLDLRTRESADFLAINGIQTQSAACLDLLAHTPQLAAMGVGTLRVNPHSSGTLAAVAALDLLRAGEWAPQVTPPAGMARCNGYWFGKPGIELRELPA